MHKILQFLSRMQAVWICCAAVSCILLQSASVSGQTTDKVKARCIALELYTRSTDEKSTEVVDAMKKYADEKRGVSLRIYDLDTDAKAGERLEKIATAYKVSFETVPFLYGMNHTFSDPTDVAGWRRRLDEMLRVEIFTRAGCSRCARAKEYLPSFQAKYPGLEVQVFEVLSDPSANRRFNDLANSQHIGGVSFPGFWMCKQLTIGFDSVQISAPRLEGILKKWTYECELPKRASLPIDRFRSLATSWIVPGTFFAMINIPMSAGLHQEPSPQPPPESERAPPDKTDSTENEPPPPLRIEGETEQPELEIGVPNEPPALDISPGESTGEVEKQVPYDAETVELPYFGRMSVKQVGMPLFTIAIGLVDGFNPCAMWVLLFLLSVLVNLQDRWKILAVAGTFVVISGVAYFAFMAAWLNVLLLVGFLRWVQIILAVLAIVVGTIHIKDFFAFKQGVSLSIPESAKPGIYSRVRHIVLAESLMTAILGAMILAVLVNIIELLCTAGLPALYSQVLMLQNYPVWENYAYLFLYIVAYMFDDTIMVGVVVVTLGKKKLQETQGRWLKLVSGLVVLLLGLVLMFKPQWLE